MFRVLQRLLLLRGLVPQRSFDFIIDRASLMAGCRLGSFSRASLAWRNQYRRLLSTLAILRAEASRQADERGRKDCDSKK